MTGEFDDRHESALRASDRAQPLDAEARQRIGEQALLAFDRHRSGGLGPVELIASERDAVGGHDRRMVQARWLVAAAAVVIAVAGFARLASRDDTSSIEVSGPETTPELADEVREWCRENLSELGSGAGVAFGAPNDVEARSAAVAALVEAVDGYFWLLLDSGVRQGTQRANEVGRFGGEAAVIRDRAEPVSIAELTALIEQFDEELAVTSDGDPACEIQP